MKQSKILVYTSSAGTIPSREGKVYEAGTWLSEIVEPLDPLYEAGHRFDFATPDGKPCVLDKSSFKLAHWGLSKKRLDKAQAFIETLNGLGFGRPTPIADILADQTRLASYDVLFIPGGRAPMTDVLFRNWVEGAELNADTGKVLRYFHDHGKTTALICHGPAVLGAAPHVDGKWIYDGYQMTCVSMFGEYVTEDLPFFGNGHHLPDYPTKILKRNGGHVQHVMLGRTLVVEDRELITAQDPVSGAPLGKVLLERLRA